MAGFFGTEAAPPPLTADIPESALRCGAEVIRRIDLPVHVQATWSLPCAAQGGGQLPGSHVLKAFNTTFAGTLATGSVGTDPTTVLIAGDDEAAKTTLGDVVRGGGLQAVAAGALKRGRELEALGFLQLTLAAAEKTSWTGGFALVN